MPISTTENRKIYAGDGISTAFAFPYLFFAAADLTVVLVDDATGVETVQTLTTHYTVTGANNPAGGTVTMVTAPAAGKTLVILREVELKQEVDLVENDPLPVAAIEEAMDRSAMMAQQQQEQIDRSLRLPVAAQGVSTTLPAPNPRRALMWDASGTALANSNIDPDAQVALAEQQANAAASSASQAETARAAAEGFATGASNSASEAAASAASINPANLVQRTGDQTINGLKSFQDGLITSHINGGPVDGRRQKFIAGNFTQNPWQRGTSFTVTASGTYVADRWRVDFDGTANITVDRVALATPQVINGEWCSHGLRFTVNSKSGNTFIRLSQRIEYVRTLTTLPATLQTAIQGSASFAVPVQARQHFGTGGSPSADVVTPMSSDLAVTSSLQLLATGLTVPTISGKTLGTAVNDYLGIEYSLINVPVGGHVVVPIAGIEPGPVATPFGFALPQSELALCQRYCRLSPAGIPLTTVANSTIAFATIPFEQPMRAAPVVSQLTTTIYGIAIGPNASGDYNGTNSAIDLVSADASGVARIRMTGLAAGIAQNAYYSLLTANKFVIAAEL